MSTAATALQDDLPRWNLSDLYTGPEDARLKADWQLAE